MPITQTDIIDGQDTLIGESDWFRDLRAMGARLDGVSLARESPWSDRTISQALAEDDLWVDRRAAGYTPQEALDAALHYED